MNTTSKIKKQFNQWKKYLDLLHVKYEERDFFENYEKIVFTRCSVTSLEYYKARYFMLLSEQEMENLRVAVKNTLMEKRGSMYDIENVAKKHNISLEEAQIVVDKRKSLTSGTLENYIKRYGEEQGPLRFKQSNQKSKSTKENFKLRYGEDWENRWNYYMSSRRTKSLDHFIKKYGEKEGKEHYEQSRANAFKHQTLPYLIEMHGEIRGTEIYKEICAKKGHSSTLEGHISRYGEKEGRKLYKEHNLTKGYHSTLEGHIEKYGPLEGPKKYEESCLRSSSVFRELEKLYGTKQATIKYKSLTKEEIKKHLPDNAIKTPPYFKSKKGCVSKIATLFFEQLEECLGRKLQYGTKKEEFVIIDKTTGRRYFYDCHDVLSNTLIEVHGVAFHPKEGDTSWANPFGTKYEKIAEKDRKKKELAIQNGYKILVVWDNEINTKTKINKKIQQIKEQINENS
jgi:hypothetical protein